MKWKRGKHYGEGSAASPNQLVSKRRQVYYVCLTGSPSSQENQSDVPTHPHTHTHTPSPHTLPPHSPRCPPHAHTHTLPRCTHPTPYIYTTSSRSLCVCILS